jgi:formylglycine-generating enzyme required for sulfatase activity
LRTKPTVFISSTDLDLRDYRAAARDAAITADFFPSMMEYFPASGAHPPLSACLEKAAAADVVIVIVAHRYGWIPPEAPAGGKSITWLECEHAASRGIEVIPLLVDPDYPWPEPLRDRYELSKDVAAVTVELLAKVQSNVAGLQRFSDWLNTRGIRARFRSPETLAQHVTNALHEWRQRHPEYGDRPPAPVDDSLALTGYRRDVVKMTRLLPLRGIALDSAGGTSRSPSELHRIYISLDTTATQDAIPLTTLHRATGGRSGVDTIEATETVRLSAAEAIRLNRQVAILGGPGSGKTALLTHLAHSLASRHLAPDGEMPPTLAGWSSSDQQLEPILLILRDFARWLATAEPQPDVDSPSALWGFIGSGLATRQLEGAAAALKRALEDGKALVLLDGLDEIPSRQTRQSIRAAVEAFSRRFDRCRYLVSSRAQVYMEPGAAFANFTVFELAPFGPKEIDAFIESWYSELHRLGKIDDITSKSDAEQLREATRRPDLAHLAGNPLLLTVMALIQAHRGRLPNAPTQLYEEIVDILLWRWEQRLGEKESGAFTLLKEAGRSDIDLKRAVWQIAFDTHGRAGLRDDGVLTEIDESALVRAFSQLHNDKSREWAYRLVEFISQRSGLLTERAPGTFTFPHRSFQEYLAGSHLSVQEPFVHVACNLAKQGPSWRPVVLFAVGRMVHVIGAVDRALALAAELCPATLDSETISEQQLRLAWLSGEILDTVGESGSAFELGQDLRKRVPRLLAAVLRRPVVPARVRASLASTLVRLDDPRFSRKRWHLPDDESLGFVEVPGGQFLLGSDDERDRGAYEGEPLLQSMELPTYYIARWPVTVAQWAHFANEVGIESVNSASVKDPANCPVAWVSWFDAVRYCDWLTHKLADSPALIAHLRCALGLSLKDADWHVTLPTEEQWEKAARGTDGRSYPWGDEPDPERANYEAANIGRSSAVGCFLQGASPFGVEDMSGNLWEWTGTVSARRGDGVHSARFPENVDSRSVRHIAKGGAFDRSHWSIRCASRYELYPTVRSADLGFRVVLAVKAGSVVA